MRLQGKVAVITGGGAGIGRAAALLFAKEGARVAIAERAVPAGKETAALIEAAGGEALFIETDVSENEMVDRMTRRTVERFGKIDILYNNAGGSSPRDGTVTDVAIEEFWRIIRTDLFGTWLCCRHIIPHIIKAGGGSVINTVSIFGLMGLPGEDSYTPAKGGVVALTRSTAVEYAPHKIRVNAISPGATRTERSMKLLDGPGGEGIKRMHLLGFAEPIEIAYAALYFASDESRVTTGQILSVDSGVTIS